MDLVSFTSVSALVRAGGDNWLAVAGVGDVQMDLLTDTGRYSLLLHDVHYIPELQCSLFSIRKQVSRGLTPAEHVRVHFDEDGVADMILESGVTTIVVDETSLYRIDLQSTPNVSAMAIIDTEQSVEQWHVRLGHPGKKAFNALFRHVQWSLRNVDLRIPSGFQCVSYVKGKLT
ncbi:unnamed protein product [Phytophthora fragariaefolia]|uniref:Unnamed protein product n=1 Tax=Phytophthora fragariaefolia TaxID=1490495 RepID=A0A9W6XZG2_9STRA|nr:unnamed protein product [Phytophthora fragariaefolia]